jgi:hypothetical protein
MQRALAAHRRCGASPVDAGWRSDHFAALDRGQLASDFTQTKGSQALGILYEMVSG